MAVGGTRDQTSRRVNLALGGGGVKALAHVGVIQALVERDIEVASIVGTSGGALIGALFAYERAWTHREAATLEAQRCAIEDVADLVSYQEFRHLLDFTLWPLFSRGAFAGKSLEKWLAIQLLAPDGLDGITFGELAFDLTVTATESSTGECWALSRRIPDANSLGVAQAVRASLSFQMVLHDAPIRLGGREIVCWDGGTTGNCRFDLAYRNDPQIPTVASSLTYDGRTGLRKIPWILSAMRPLLVTSHTVSIMHRQMETIMESLLPPGRISIVRPECRGTGVFSFGLDDAQRASLIRAGYDSAQNVLDAVVW